MDAEWFISAVILAVSELPDRNSPADDPDMMLVTGKELRAILLDKFEHAGLLVLCEEIAAEELMNTKGSA